MASGVYHRFSYSQVAKLPMGILDFFLSSSQRKIKAQERETQKLSDSIREWQRVLRIEQRSVDKQISDLSRQEKKVLDDIKKAIKADRKSVAKILAKEIVRSKKALDKMYSTKASLNSLSMQLNQHQALMKVTVGLSKSSELMSTFNQLTRTTRISQDMQQLSQEMMKAGLIQEMIQESLDSIDDVEEEADEEVDRVVQGICDELNIPTPSFGLSSQQSASLRLAKALNSQE